MMVPCWFLFTCVKCPWLHNSVWCRWWLSSSAAEPSRRPPFRWTSGCGACSSGPGCWCGASASPPSPPRRSPRRSRGARATRRTWTRAGRSWRTPPGDPSRRRPSERARSCGSGGSRGCRRRWVTLIFTALLFSFFVFVIVWCCCYVIVVLLFLLISGPKKDGLLCLFFADIWIS